MRNTTMKILPTDDLNWQPDYNKNYKRYFPHIHKTTVKPPFWRRLWHRIKKVVVGRGNGIN